MTIKTSASTTTRKFSARSSSATVYADDQNELVLTGRSVEDPNTIFKKVTITPGFSVTEETIGVISGGGAELFSISNIIITDSSYNAITETAIDSSSGDAYIKIIGSGFSSVGSVSVDSEPVTGYTITSGTELRINLQFKESGYRDLLLKNVTGDQGTYASITYQNERLIWYAQPTTIYIIPGESVSLKLKINNSFDFGETYSVAGNTPLPAGLSLSSAGVLSGTVSAGDAGQYTVSVIAANEFNQTTSRSFSIVVRDNRWNASQLQILPDYGTLQSLQQTSKFQTDSFLAVAMQGIGYSDSSPKIHDVVFSPDGYYMYSSSAVLDIVIQYYCSTPWQVSTAEVLSYIDTNTLNSSISWIYGMAFKPDGSKLYLTGRTTGNTDTLFEFTLATNWMISSCSFTTSALLSPVSVDAPGSIYFKPDGTRVWIFSINSSIVREINLSSAWNISTMSLSKSLQFATGDNSWPAGVAKISLNNTGTVFYYSNRSTLGGFQQATLYTLSLTTAWTLNSNTTGVTTINYSLPSDGTNNLFSSGIVLNNDIPLYAITERYIYSISTTPAVSYNPRNMISFRGVTTAVSNSYTLLSTGITSTQTGIYPLPVSGSTTFCVDSYEKNFYVAYNSNKTIVRVKKSISGVLEYQIKTITQITGTITGIGIRRDGSQLYVSESTNIHVFNLPIRYDLSRVTYNQVYDLSRITSPTTRSTINSFQISDDGKEICLMIGTGYVTRHTLGTAWDLSTIQSAVDVRPVEANSTSFSFDYQSKTLTTWSPSTAIREVYTNYGSYDLSAWAWITSNIDTSPQHIIFDSSGTRMYIVGTTSNNITQYKLQVAWDITTAYAFYRISTSQLFGISLSSVGSIAFNTDGTKLYAVYSSDDIVRQYSLTRAWEISSLVSDDLSFSVNTQDSSPAGIFFKPDGAKMYILGGASDRVYEYSLSTSWNISTASLVTSFSVAAQETGPSDVFFNNNGSKMYVVGSASDSVQEYNLLTPWSVATAVLNSSFSIVSQEGTSSGMYFKPDGTSLYVIGSGADTVYAYNLSSPWEVGTASYTGIFYRTVQPDTAYTGLFFKPDGTSFFVLGTTRDTVVEHKLDTAWMTSTAKYYKSAGISVATQDTTSTGLYISPDGLNVYTVGSTNDAVYRYSLSTAWDIHTMTYVNSFSVTTEETNPQDIYFKDDGTKMYVIGSVGDDINEYNLSTAWDITTAVYSTVFSVVARDINPNGLTFRSDGLKMYITGSSTDRIYEYNLGTPWSIATAVFANQSQAITTYQSSPTGIAVDSLGKYCYVLGTGTTSLIQLGFV